MSSASAVIEENRTYPPSVQPGIPMLGVTPPGWQRIPLKEVLEPVNRPASIVDSEQYQLVTAKRSRGGIVPREILYGRQIKTKAQFFIEAGDFLISRRQIAHGACGLVPQALHRAIVSNEYSTLLTKEGLDSRFLNHLAHSVYFQQTCFHSSIGVHVEKLVFKLEDWLEWPFDLPLIDEQRRIANALDAWDRAIEATAALIIAKRRRFRWLYRELITLPARDLGAGWRIAPLSEVATIRFSGVDKKTMSCEHPVRLCNYMDVFTRRRITADLPFMKASATDREVAAFSLRPGDVLFTKDSETPEEIAETAFVAEQLDGVLCGYHLALARPRTQLIDGEFLALVLRHPRVRCEFSKRANGATRFGLTLDAMDEIDVFFPSLPHQKLIVAALRQVEREIELLEQQLQPLQAQKRGLVQKLLTGEWRLPDESLAAEALLKAAP